MNSNFLNSLGLGTVDIGFILLGLLIISVLLLILIVVAFVKIGKFKKKYEKFMLGKDGANLEKDIMTLYEDNKYMKLSIEKTFQKVGLVKYDAFTEMGGKLSFALALLDEKNNGFIINSVHSSEGCYSYTKRVLDGDSQIALSNEEKVAVERAVNGNTSDNM